MPTTVAEDRRDRAHESARLVSVLAAVVFPAWSVFDVLLEPEAARTIIAVRLAGMVPVLVAVWVLWRRRLGRGHPEPLVCLVLSTVQCAIAWMVPRVDSLEFYLLGFTLAVYASGCLLVSRPVWTGAVAAASWSALAVAVLTAPAPMPVRDLAAAGIYLASASVLGLLAHHQRHRLATREAIARARLEREQERTRVLLARLERLSHEDALTGLANRRRWDAELAAACATARESGAPLAVVLADVDHFKQVNDRHGHAGGDAALCQVAGLLRDRVRAGDLVARLGGDELAVLLPGADHDRARDLAEALRQAAAVLRPPGFAPGEVTLSLGVAVASGGDAVPQRLTAAADAQLYRAKATRNAVCTGPWTPAPVGVA